MSWKNSQTAQSETERGLRKSYAANEQNKGAN